MDMSIFSDPNRPSWVTLSGKIAAEEHLAREAAAVQAAPTTFDYLAMAAAARARAHAAYLAMMPPAGVPEDTERVTALLVEAVRSVSNVPSAWADVIAQVEAARPSNAMTPQTASSDDHGWQATFAKIAEEERHKSPGRSSDDNHGWTALLSNPLPA